MYFNNPDAINIPDAELTYKNYKVAVEKVKNNVIKMDCYRKEVLSTGPGYPGIWLEHNHDSLFYCDIDADVAKNSHEIFYDFQSDDGLFPAYICKWPADEACKIGYGHIQSVYPLAASAYEIAVKTQDEEFLTRSYIACSKYDRWFKKYRNTLNTGLIEMFCGYDTGHDNSKRIADIPLVCTNGNARICPENSALPIISPDMSAMVYRAEIALADMADALGKINESNMHKESALCIKHRINEICFDDCDNFYYDVDAKGNFRKYLSEQIFRMLVNGVVDDDKFEIILEKYILSDKHFNSLFPFPSMSLSSKYFDLSLCNNWGGMTQIHTALETLFWMEQYGKKDMLKEYMQMWINIFNKNTLMFTQEVNPNTGEVLNTAPDFTTALIMYIQFAKKLKIIND